MADDTHPFERKGLGCAPFRFVKLVRESGGCAYCGRVLARSCHIADATGRQFVVGVDCVWRARKDGQLFGEMQAELRYQNKMEAAKKIEARRAVCLAVLQADPGFLADRPHPDAWRTDKTLRDETRRLVQGTVTERIRAFKIIETALAERGAEAPRPS